MKANTYLLTLGTLAAFGLACLAGDSHVPGRTQRLRAVVQGNNAFALALYQNLSRHDGNLFFSPYSISTALAMTYAGARGRTASQMFGALRLPFEPVSSGARDADPARAVEPVPMTIDHLAEAFGQLQKRLHADPKDKGYELSVANALWGQAGYDFRDEFLSLVETSYGGRLSEVDFAGATEAARKTINDWVEQKTNNRIKDLLKPGTLNELTRLVLTNAIYFKGNWASQFDRALTRPAPFTLADGSKINVPMMNQTETLGYAQGQDYQALEMPYAGNELSMVIFLPRQYDGLADLEKRFAAGELSLSPAGLPKRKVVVFIPRFKTTSRFSLASVLRSMGMTDAFAPGLADFSGINGRKDLCISAVVHKAFVEVNEQGTEAAAATGVVIGVTSVAPVRPPVFRADRPFLFLIRDNRTGSILFLGRLTNPSLAT